MQKFFLLLSLLFLPSHAKEKNHISSPTNSFHTVWGEVISDPRKVLPQETLSYAKLFDATVDLISKNANRTLNERADIIKSFDKLAHPNGVCLSGIWEINKENPYGGLFKNGSKSLIIARASTAMSETKRGETRAFGMAVKLFATLHPNEMLNYPTANFFVADDLGGTDTPYFMDVNLTNEPEISFTTTILGSLAYALKVANSFSSADKNSGIRQLYELSFIDENRTNVITPKWIKISARKGQIKSGVHDFREEFLLKKGEILYFKISVASKIKNGEKEWKEIGNMHFSKSVVSTTCDHRLHFHHPRWRDDLHY